MKIPDNTKIQSIDLRVRDLETSLNFYSHLLGFKEIERKGNNSFLSASGDYPYLIKLVEDKNAKPKPPRTTGLYHLAIRFPSRKELARVFLRLFDNKIKFQGFSDHLVSEAIYLSDPDGNGIELYVDKPRETWKWKSGQIQMETLPLDLSVLTNELDDREIWNGIHPDTDIGHIHLSVSNLFKAEQVYNEVIGFNITNSSYPGALFFSAGRYHHHIGTNIWSTRNGNPPLENSLGLISFTIKIPDKDFLKSIEYRAKDLNIFIESKDENNIYIQDFDKNKIKLTL